MKRTQIQLDDETHAALRKIAYESGASMASVVRDTLSRALGTDRRGKKKPKLTFIGMGASRHPRLEPVSENHDEAFVEAIEARFRR
jgi:plasmid stability protein